MWKLIDKPKTVKVTAKLAKQYAEMDPAPHDRPLSERRLMVYRKIVLEGGFRPVSWASALCVETGGVYRVNGKHTSTMLAAMNPIPDFYAVIEDYECDTLEDVAKLYATFDSTIQSRNARDIYCSFAACVPELKGLPNTHIGLAVTGMQMHVDGGRANDGSRTSADRAEMLLEHPDFVVWMSTVLSAGPDLGKRSSRSHSKHLRRQPVVAAMMGCWQKAKEKSLEFWSAVRDETGESPNNPDRKLARYLLTVGVDSGGGSHRLRPVPPREMYVKCIHAWNAWRKGENTALQYYSEKDVPVIK